MDRYGYSRTLSTGIVAASGTLGCLIPPSVPLIIYGIITEQSIGKLFLASVFPGLLVSLFFMLIIYGWCSLNPSLGPKGERSSWRQRMASLKEVAGVAIAFAEAIEFYPEYARNIVTNSKALAQGLYERGIGVLYEKKGFTESHMMIMDVTKYGNGFEIEKRLEKANIIVNRNLLPYDKRMGRDYKAPGGIRVGTQELTRLGMGKSEMVEVAELMKRVICDGEEPQKIAPKVAELRATFQSTKYCYSSLTQAYEHIKIR
jgi:glycine hydroxymethyltransferase